MKNKRFVLSEQMNSKVSSLIVAFSCISVFMLIVYVGMSLTSKGTYSAVSNSGYGCPNGTTYVTNATGTLNKCCPSGYTSSLQYIASGVVCANSNYSSGDIKISSGTVYCGTTIDPTAIANCTSNGGSVENGKCYKPCAVASSEATYSTCSVNITFCEITEKLVNTAAQATVNVTKNNGSTPYNYSWTLKYNGAVIKNIGSGTNETATTLLSNNIDATDLHSGQVLEATLTVTVPGGVTCTDKKSISVDRCDSCESTTTTTTTTTCYKCKDSGTGYDTQTFTGSTCPSGWQRNVPTCTTASTQPTESITCHKCTGNGTTSSSSTFTGSTCPSGWFSYTPDCIYANKCLKGTGETVYVQFCMPYVSGNCETNPSANASVMCMTNAGARPRCNLTETTAANCQPTTTSTTQTPKKSCIYCHNGTTASIANAVATTSNCSTINTSTTHYYEVGTTLTCSKTCYFCDGTDRDYAVTRMDTKWQSCRDFNDPYGNPLSDNMNSLTCEEPKITRTCYRCSGTDISNGISVEMNSDETCEDYNYLSSNNVNQCRNTCYYCDGTSPASTYISKSKTCSQYGYANSANELTCDAGTITCYRCDGPTTVPVTVDLNQYSSCAAAGYKSSRSQLSCAKTCYKCDSSSPTPREEEVGQDENCPSGWYESEPTCIKTCYYCDGTTSASTTFNMDASKNCSTKNGTYLYEDTPQTCAKRCQFCSNGGVDYLNDVYFNSSCSGRNTSSIIYYEEGETPTCTKTCYYCSNGTTASTSLNMDASFNCPEGYENNKNNLQCDAGKITCWNCDGITPTPVEVDKNQYDTCADAGYKADKDELTCSKTCHYCNGTEFSDTLIPFGEECSEHNSLYKEDASELNCTADKKLCYHCVGEKTEPIEIDATDECSNHAGYEDDASDLTCVKCCDCSNGKKVEKGDSNNGSCPTGQTRCDQLVCKNVQTGSTSIVIAWIIGLSAIGYAVYYFKRTNKKLD